MTSLDAMEEEIENQLEDLPRFAKELSRQDRYSHVNVAEMVFAGSGDSYAAALLAQELSRGQAAATDPYELYLNPARAKAKHVFLISVSGRTRANLELARRVKRLAKKRIAITAKAESQLARVCDDTILLRYRKGGGLTSGTVSFTSSLLACASLVGKLPRRFSLKTAMEKAAAWAEKPEPTRKGSFLFLGSGVDYALASYGASKIQEVLGVRAGHQYPEQFGHAQLFSVDPKQDRIICIISDPSDRAQKVFRALSGGGFQVYPIRARGKEMVTRSLEVSLHLQHLALRLARRTGMKDCAFLVDEAGLNVSNLLIY